ncbi:hypothetical protein CJ030_MR0G007990 [Morella rubra]|uniref:non-specific serine/threonine protein kinase n=1 Tax=Morella rubra TaxID=262757 RepID=A0A6A1UIS8_9ROSI|nr:hypothetical protein CJ030_MR0G007990 [Morella rubra]
MSSVPTVLRTLFCSKALLHLRINVLICTFMLASVWSENSGYESCPPGNCGTGPNISYPFYVFGTGEDNCGLPGFGIGCNQSKPIYETSTGQYVIRDIFYENQTFRLVNGEFADGSCFARLHNFTFDRSSLQFTRNHADLLFFYHCNASFSIGYEKSVVACASNATLRSFVVLVNDVRHFNESTSDCEAFVAAPVELEGGYCNQTIGNVDYRKLLKNGFTLEWSGFDCVACQRSGGRCGYEKGDNVCYCHDRIHHSSCHEAPKLVHTRGIARFLEDVKKLRKTSNPSTFQSFLFSPIALQARETCNLQRIQSGTTPASRQRYKVLKSKESSLSSAWSMGKMSRKLPHLSGVFGRAQEDQKHPQKCNPFFCEKLGWIDFPFANTTNPECGVWVVDDCESLNPTIQFVEGGKSYELIAISQGNSIRIRDPRIAKNLSSGICESVTNSTHPPSFPFIFYWNETFLKCKHNLNVSSLGKVSNISCSDYNFYYKVPNTPQYPDRTLPKPFPRVPSGCSILQLPVHPFPSPHDEHPNGTAFAEFDLQLQVSDCYKCSHGGRRCQTNTSGVLYCDKAQQDQGKEEKATEGNGISRAVVIGATVCQNLTPPFLTLLGVGGSALLVIIGIFVIFLWRCKRKTESSNFLRRNLTSSRSDLDGSVYFGVPVFSYTELQEATNNFDFGNELGDGGFGTVYYGKLRDGREVAVKRLYEHNYRRVEQFLNEVKILTRLRHRNLVSLYGCTSRHSRELLLVNFCVKVADFGLSRLFPTDVSHVSTAPQGTPGYVDPDYHQCYQLTSKSDVYSFGVVLIELVSSLPAVDIARHRHEINLANLAINKIEKCEFHELLDPHLGFESDDEVKRMAISVAQLAFQCLQQDKELRPTMEGVLEELQNIQSGSSVNVQPPNSPECDEAGLLKNKQLPPSPNSVTDNWTSRSTTPNVSG